MSMPNIKLNMAAKKSRCAAGELGAGKMMLLPHGVGGNIAEEHNGFSRNFRC